jgi:hypothetical protein
VKETCLDCLGKGWDLYNEDSTGVGEIQACDCGIFLDDETATAAALDSGQVAAIFEGSIFGYLVGYTLAPATPDA